jgi:hypothetical protein
VLGRGSTVAGDTPAELRRRRVWRRLWIGTHGDVAGGADLVRPCAAYAEHKWTRSSAKHRASIAKPLAIVTPVLVHRVEQGSEV